jgi:hypothetical protein
MPELRQLTDTFPSLAPIGSRASPAHRTRPQWSRDDRRYGRAEGLLPQHSAAAMLRRRCTSPSNSPPALSRLETEVLHQSPHGDLW